MANILIACEESQAICKAFRDRGHNAYSCDILECSGGHPEWHFKQDVLKVIPECGGTLENGETYFLPKGEMWDLMIARPPRMYVSFCKWSKMVVSSGRFSLANRRKKRTSTSYRKKAVEKGSNRVFYGVYKDQYKALGYRKPCRVYEL